MSQPFHGSYGVMIPALPAKIKIGPGSTPRSIVARAVRPTVRLSQPSDRDSGSPVRMYIMITTRR
ncbi:hypothetical protein IH799_02355 [candidate division KSB1 bacterium]|nr:hypothetical protein [candidate division KSB1 bacterium]